MGLTEDIQAGIKSKNVVIGYNESIQYMRVETPKIIIIANNLPSNMKQEIEHNAKIGKTKLEIFGGTSRELGVVCGKPFPVTTIIIK